MNLTLAATFTKMGGDVASGTDLASVAFTIYDKTANTTAGPSAGTKAADTSVWYLVYTAIADHEYVVRATATPATGVYLRRLTEVREYVSDALVSSRYAGTPPTASDIATAVWAATVRTITAGGTTAQQVWEYVTRELTSSGGATAEQVRIEMDANSTKLATLTNRLGAFTGTGVNTVLGAFKAALSKSATLPSDIGGTFTPVTDSTEALAEAASAIAAKTALIGTATVNVTSSIIGDVLTIEPGDSYGQAVGRAAHSVAMPGDWTGGGTATLLIGATSFAVTVGSYTSGTGTTALTCAMTAAETAALDTGEQVYTWRAVKGTGATASKRSVVGTVSYGQPLAEVVTP